MDIKKIITKAGVHVDEFATLCSVSRVAVYGWFNGATIHPLRKGRVGRILEALESAIEHKDLPIERPKVRKVEKEAVTARIKEIVIKHLKLTAKAD